MDEVLDNIEIELENSNIKKYRIENRIKGLVFGILVLIGNGIHPIINNTRPILLDPLNFVLQMSIFEFLFAIPPCLLEIKGMKKRGEMIKIPKQKNELISYLFKLFLIGFIFTIANYFYVLGLEMAGSVSGSIALKVSPLYLLLIGALFLGEKFDWKQLFLVIWMLIGLFFLATEGTWRVQIFSLGFGILLVTPLLWSVGHAITKTLLQKHQIFPSMVILVRTGVITILIFLFTLIFQGWHYISSSFINLEYQWFSFLMGITYFFMHFGWYSAIRHLDLSFTSALVTPSPVLTILFAILFTNESIYLYQIIGMIWVFIGLYILILNKRKLNID